MRLVLLGPPGAGKGTQATGLAGRHGVPHVSTGEMLRRSADEGSELGLRARALIDRGMFVPDDVAVGIVAERLAQGDASRGFVLDGFPRTASQAGTLDAMLAASRHGLDAALELRVDEAALLARVEARARDAIARGGSPRADDNAEALALRLREYAERTRPVSGYYAARGLLLTVDAMGPIEDVGARIAAALARCRRAA